MLGFVLLSALFHVLGVGFAFSPPTFMARASKTATQLSVVLLPANRAQPSMVAEESMLATDQPRPVAAIAEQIVKSTVKVSAPTDRFRRSVKEMAPLSPNREEKPLSRPNLLEPASINATRPASDYRAVGLDPPPRPLSDIEPEYPLTQGLREGVVVLRLLINEKGIVDEAIVVRSFPPGVFDSSAVVAFGSAKFSPGMFLGLPVKSQLTVEVEFMPTNRGAAVSGRGY